MANGIQQVSEGQIRTGVYHADIGDGEKERLHKRWRKGEVKVVCATIGETTLASLIDFTDSFH